MIIYLIILIIIKLFLLKLIKIIYKKDFEAHIVSFILSTIFIIIILFYNKFGHLELFYFVISSILLSYTLINFPGAYATSLSIKIIQKIYEKKIENYNTNLEEKLFEDRLKRLIDQKVIEYNDNKQIIIISNKLNLIIILIDTFKKLKDIIALK
jgi:hypothetical protein